MSNTNIQTNQTFEEKLRNKIRESIGDLITDEDLSKIVEKGIHETFFKAKIDPSRYGNTVYKDPFIVDILKELLQKEVNEQVNNWLENNPDKIKESMDKVIREGIGNAVLNALNSKFQNELFAFQSNIENKLS